MTSLHLTACAAMALALAGHAETSARAEPGYCQALAHNTGSGWLTQLIDEQIETQDVPGAYVAVTCGGSIAYERALGVWTLDGGEAYTAHSPARLASATKVLASLTFLSLAEDGVMGLDEPLGALDPETPAAWRDVPVWRVLNHSSGIPRIVIREDFNALPQDQALALDEDALIAFIEDEPLDFAPGEGWHYQQSGYVLLARGLRHRTGLSWAELVDQHVLQPAGMSSTGYTRAGENQAPAYRPERDGGDALVWQDAAYPVGMSQGGGYDSTGADMTALAVALWRGDIVSPEFLAAALSPERLERLGRDVEGEGYGPATVVQLHGDTLSFGHSGGGGLAEFRYAPEPGVGLIVLTNRTGGSTVTSEITEAISVRLFGLARRTPVAD